MATADVPEGGGSIRASNPAATGSLRRIAEHDPAERVVAEVVEVKRGAFPKVALRLKLKSSAELMRFAIQYIEKEASGHWEG